MHEDRGEAPRVADVTKLISTLVQSSQQPLANQQRRRRYLSGFHASALHPGNARVATIRDVPRNLAEVQLMAATTTHEVITAATVDVLHPAEALAQLAAGEQEHGHAEVDPVHRESAEAAEEPVLIRFWGDVHGDDTRAPEAHAACTHAHRRLCPSVLANAPRTREGRHRNNVDTVGCSKDKRRAYIHRSHRSSRRCRS